MNARQITRTVALLAITIAAMTSTASAEIEFVEVGGMPIIGDLVIDNPPFMAGFLHGPPCEELPAGIWGPPCIAVYCGWFADDGGGSAMRLSAGEPIGTHLPYSQDTVLAGFEVANPTADPNDWTWRAIDNDWFDRSGAPVRGYIGWGGDPAAGDPHYGWIELTVEYDPALEEFNATLHGYAYETEPGVPIVAGDPGPCIGDLDSDGAVGLSDLSALLANYGVAAGATYEDGDLDGDGDVDLSDLSTLLSVYGAACP